MAEVDEAKLAELEAERKERMFACGEAEGQAVLAFQAIRAPAIC